MVFAWEIEGYVHCLTDNIRDAEKKAFFFKATD